MQAIINTKRSATSYIPINAIRTNPNQPRRIMDRDKLEELASSISLYGVLQPITVRRINVGEYELIAGERRFRACRMLGMNEIPAIVLNADKTDSAILALIENIQRENLNYMEEAEAFSELISRHGLTQEELADRLGKRQSTIANKLRILRLSDETRRIIAENSLTERHARALLRLPDEKSRMRVLKTIISRGLNVAKSEELIAEELKHREEPPEPPTERDRKSLRVFKDVRIFSNTIKQAVNMMKQAGIEALAEKNENDDFIEYIIKIPKNQTEAEE